MSTIQAELYEALIEADASKEKAHAAAAAVATITTNYPKPEELATKEYIEKRVAERSKVNHRKSQSPLWTIGKRTFKCFKRLSGNIAKSGIER